jgi:hypothetical protein
MPVLKRTAFTLYLICWKKPALQNPQKNLRFWIPNPATGRKNSWGSPAA